MNSTELKPCPFCGGDELSHGHSFPPHRGEVQCHTCDALIVAGNEAAAIAAWNRRASINSVVCEAGGWRPIETAPKDGTGILACWPKRKLDDDDLPTGEIVSYAQCVTAWQGFWIEPDYLDAHGSYYMEDEAFADEPTHWMPLPPPPGSARDSAEADKTKAGATVDVPACLCGQPISDECKANGCRWNKEKSHG